jgi:hypothetical protein
MIAFFEEEQQPALRGPAYFAYQLTQGLTLRVEKANKLTIIESLFPFVKQTIYSWDSGSYSYLSLKQDF